MPDLPTDWTLDTEETRFDDMMGRDYTTVCYRNDDTAQTVRIFEVQQPKSSTWGFQVRSSGWTGRLGAADDLDAAKELARSYMTTAHPA